jgi:hypothetical protein
MILSTIDPALPFDGAADDEKFANLLHNLLKLAKALRSKNHLEIRRIDNRPAAGSPFAEQFIKSGYEKDGDRLALWPSRIKIFR